MPRSRRLRTRRDYARTQRQGVRAATEVLVLLARPVRPGTGRVGFTVSRKVGNAVTRNLVKRRLRDIFRHRKALFDARDLIVIVQPKAAELSFDALVREVEKAAARLDAAQERAPRGGRGPRPRGPRSGKPS